MYRFILVCLNLLTWLTISKYDLIASMKSYEFGLIQTKAFRALKGHTLKLLQPYSLTTYEWAVLGVLFEAEVAGCRITELADILHVSKPFITKTVGRLTDKGWVCKSTVDETDKRSVRIMLTPHAQKEIPVIEKYLRAETKHVFKGIGKTKLFFYMQVLQQISDRLEENIKDGPVDSG